MFYMNSSNNKRAHITSVSVAEAIHSVIKTFPKIEYVNIIRAEWIKLPVTTPLFSESDYTGSLCQQTFEAIITTFSQNQEKQLKLFCSKPLLLKIDYSNGESKLIGTPNVPVYLTLTSGNEYHQYIIKFKRTSPDLSKFIK